jgi:hypothetical protein
VHWDGNVTARGTIQRRIAALALTWAAMACGVAAASVSAAAEASGGSDPAPVGTAGTDGAPPRPSVRIGWSTGSPEIDGRLAPDEWADAAHLEGLVQATPDAGAAPTQRSEIWLMTDGDSLFVAARLWDTDPAAIVAFQMERDADVSIDDRFSITIDPFLDRQNGYLFEVNPNGARRDGLIEGQTVATDWDGRWSARTSVDATGWTVEIELPFSTISFDPDHDVWGLNLARGLRRRNEIDRWADPVRERMVTAMGRAGDLAGMTGVRQGLGLQIVPAGTLRRVDDWNDPPDSGDRRHYTKADPSLDVFYKPVPSFTSAVTVNTDFAEADVDARQVNLSRFELFFPEKREFFLQDTLIFDFADLEENGRPFFSRSIGLNDEGEPEDILAGGKLTGRFGPLEVGVLDVVLDEHDDVDPQNLLVARATANVGESSIGAIATHGDPSARGSNTLVGVDLNFRDTDFAGGRTFYATAWAQASFSDPDTGPGADPDAVDGRGLAYGGSLEYPNDIVNWEVAARSYDDQFDPALGFVNRRGIRDFAARYRQRWRPVTGPWQTVDSEVDGLLVTDERAATVETASLAWTALELMTPVGDGIRLRYEHRYEFVDTPFDNLAIPVGRYHFDEGEVQLTASTNRPVGGQLVAGYGTFFGGERARAQADLDVRLSRHVQAGVVYGVDRIWLPDGDEWVHVVNTRLGLYFTPELSWVTIVQFDNVSDSMGINSRLRWIIEDGRELFLVVNQDFDTRDDVRAGRTEPLVKLQWTFWL